MLETCKPQTAVRSATPASQPALEDGARPRQERASSSLRIVCLPGDGIGPEVVAAATRVLEALPLETSSSSARSVAARSTQHGDPLPPETLDACRDADAILLGAVGLPEFDAAQVRPEQGLIRLRGELDVYANLRPTRGDGIDLLIVRELVGGLYFGASGRRDDGSAFDTCDYSPRRSSGSCGAGSNSRAAEGSS